MKGERGNSGVERCKQGLEGWREERIRVRKISLKRVGRNHTEYLLSGSPTEKLYLKKDIFKARLSQF